MDINSKLIQINQGLLERGVSLRIEQRGGRLNLRGPLPDKETGDSMKVQRISLHLPANQKSIDESEKILEMVLLQIKHNQFSWSHWGGKQKSKKAKELPDELDHSIQRFKEAFFLDPHRRKSISGMKTTWHSAYLPYIRRLSALARSQKKFIDSQLLLDALKSYGESTRSRQQCATALGALAKYLEIQLPNDWRAEASGYGLHQAHFRELPNDKTILEGFLKIPNPRWRLVYGLMATYGLRNHEVFFCDLSALGINGDKVLRVLPTTKTGEHQVWPFHPEWIEIFGLEQLGNSKGLLPAVKTNLRETTLQQVGRRVSEQFRRYELPISPYDLRHAWAVRTIHIGLPDTVSARMMGHSVAIHTRTYHHWITRRDQQQAVDTALSRKAS